METCLTLFLYASCENSLCLPVFNVLVDSTILDDLDAELESWIRPWCFRTVGVTPLFSSLPILPVVPGSAISSKVSLIYKKNSLLFSCEAPTDLPYHGCRSLVQYDGKHGLIIFRNRRWLRQAARLNGLLDRAPSAIFQLHGYHGWSFTRNTQNLFFLLGWANIFD